MKMISMLCFAFLTGLILSGCCSMTWYGACIKNQPIYNPNQPKYDAYEQNRIRKVVPGLGGATYPTR